LKEQLKEALGTHNLDMLEKMKHKMVLAVDDMEVSCIETGQQRSQGGYPHTDILS
jgi:hypothetical protein